MSDARTSFVWLHDGPPREGPDPAEDVSWASAQAGLSDMTHIFDAGSDPGGEVPVLRPDADTGLAAALDEAAPVIATRHRHRRGFCHQHCEVRSQ